MYSPTQGRTYDSHRSRLGHRRRAVARLRRPHAVAGRRRRRAARTHPQARRRAARVHRRLRDEARLAAEAADKAIRSGHRVGPLHGVPIALKDLVDIEGRVTTGGSKVWAERVSPVTATLAERLIARGHDRARQDAHRGVRHGQLGHQHAHGHAAQPLGPRRAPHAGRLLERLRRGRRRRPGAGRHRHRHGRLGAAAGRAGAASSA